MLTEKKDILTTIRDNKARENKYLPMWKNHDPFKRASKELIREIERIEKDKRPTYEPALF